MPGALPWIFPSNAVIEQVLFRAERLPGAVDSIPMFNIANGQSTMATVEHEESGAAIIRFAEAVLDAEVSEDGSLVGLSFRGQGQRVVREDAFGRLPIEEVDYGPPDGAFGRRQACPSAAL
jgi:hypothetical protein